MQDEKINFNDRETVFATGTTKAHRKGAEISVHPVQARALIESGKATAEPPAELPEDAPEETKKGGKKQ